MQDNKTAGKYNRRVELLKPVTVENEYNEAKTTWVVAYGNFPAKKFDQTSGDAEQESNNAIKGVIQVKWDIRFIPNLGIKTDWKLKDIFDGTIYNIVAPPTEIGFRQGIQVIAEIVQ